MANIGYVRVSTQEQNTGRQYEGFNNRGIVLDVSFEEHISAKDTNRPQLKAMLAYVRKGDTVYIESISRLARNTKDFLDIIEKLQVLGVDLVSLKEDINTSTPTGKFMVTVFSALAEMERDTIRDRQREGIELAIKQGKAFGRPKACTTDTFNRTYRDWKAGKITAVEAMKLEGMKKTTFYKLVKEYENTTK